MYSRTQLSNSGLYPEVRKSAPCTPSSIRLVGFNHQIISGLLSLPIEKITVSLLCRWKDFVQGFLSDPIVQCSSTVASTAEKTSPGKPCFSTVVGIEIVLFFLLPKTVSNHYDGHKPYNNNSDHNHRYSFLQSAVRFVFAIEL